MPTETDLTTVAGYECPKNTSKLARKVLRQLRKRGTVIFIHDDGPSLLVRTELVEIAGAIGLICHQDHYRLTLLDEDQVKSIDGSEASTEECDKQ